MVITPEQKYIDGSHWITDKAGSHYQENVFANSRLL
jgi:hypothetical protein